MSRPLLVTLFVLARTSAAHAFTPIPHAEVKSLQGKRVFLADSVELDRKARVWGYTGQGVTLERCDKTTSTISADGAKVSGWRYSRCKVKTAEGVTGTVSFERLSKTALAFDLSKPPASAALRRAAFDEAYATALAMVSFAKAHAADLGSDVVTSTLDGAPVLGEYDVQWQAMAAAQRVAQKLHRELVIGSRMTTESILRDRQYGWVADAQNEELMTVWSKGVQDAGKKKQLEAGMSCLGKLNGVAGWGTLATRIADERAAKSWRRGVSGTASQQAALDKEHEARLDKRLKDGNASFEKQLAQAQAAKKSLRW